MTKKNTTQIAHEKAVKKKLELEEIMSSGLYAKCLKEELTAIYFINNLLLIPTKN